MKYFFALLLSACFANAPLWAQDEPVKRKVFDAERSVQSCKSLKAETKYLTCFAEAYKYAHIILELEVGNALMRVQMRTALDVVMQNILSIEANIKDLQAVNRAYVPMLREEMKDAPVALSLLPKLHAAFDTAVTGEMFEIGESKIALKQRVAKNHASVLSLLKEVEFSQ